ncbi:MAG: bile acid:sodium symporter family protein [Saprospiraceae bacterium]
MSDIDAIHINFNPDQLILLNICLAFLMFGVALDIKLSDFRRIFEQPKAPIVGLISEYLLLPILCIILVYIFQPPASIALGMVMISCCPGGSTSNFMVHLAKANAALSVLLTSITTLAAIVILPLAFSAWSYLIPADGSGINLEVDPIGMVKTIIQLVFIPVGIGMYINHRFPNFTKKIERPVRLISIFIFFCFVVFAVAGNYENILSFIHLVFLIVLVHNGLAFIMGYYFARWNRLSIHDSRAISIETGIQNTGLGLILAFNFFDGLGGMTLIIAWWGVWHLISGFLLATYWSKN